MGVGEEVVNILVAPKSAPKYNYESCEFPLKHHGYQEQGLT